MIFATRGSSASVGMIISPKAQESLDGDRSMLL
jgi:hypothetical protein